MAGTPEGNRKIAAKLKELYGVDEYGRSIFHAAIGSSGGQKMAAGFFKGLAETDPERLKKIAAKGGKTKRGVTNSRRASKQVEQS